MHTSSNNSTQTFELLLTTAFERINVQAIMKHIGQKPTTAYQCKPVVPCHCWSSIKVVGFTWILLVCMSSVMFIANQRLQSEMTKMRTTLLKRNYLLNNRIKRNALASSDFASQSSLVVKKNEEVMTIRKKRSSSNNQPEEVRTPSFGTGVTYKRWGRRDCSGPNNELIYHGIAAGSHYSHTGGASNALCFHNNVTYPEGKYINGHQGTGHIYGMEYRDGSWVNRLFDLSLTEDGSLQYHSVPCAICLAVARYNQLMIPGRDTCPEGWHIEYTGFIMNGAYTDKHSSEAICVDDTPQVVPGTGRDDNGAYLFMAEPVCVSLLCEPYVHGRELRCVVCTV